MNTLRTTLFAFGILLVMITPFASVHADTWAIFCNQKVVVERDTNNPGQNISKFVNDSGQASECGWPQLVMLANNFMNKLVEIGVAFSAVVFAYAGFKIMTAGGNSNQVTEAKKMFWKVVQGLVMMLAAWLIVNTIIVALLGPDYTLLG